MTQPLSRRRLLGAAAAAGAAGLLAGGTAKASASRVRRAPIPSGVYAISKPQEQLLTLDHPRGPVTVLEPVGRPGVQEWEAQSLPNGNVTLRNLFHGTYAAYDGDPRPHKLIHGRADPTEWVLRQSAEPFAFHVVVPGGPVDGIELALDLSLLLIYPPRTALRPYRPYDQRQAWRFEFHE